MNKTNKIEYRFFNPDFAIAKSGMNVSLNKKYLSHIILITIIFLLVFSFALSRSEFYQSIKWKALDLFYSVQRVISSVPQKADQIVVIAIDDAALSAAKMSWPWERSVFAEIVRKLNSFSPGLIYINFTFAGESRNREDDLLLATAMREKRNIIIPSYYDSNLELVTPLEEFSSFTLKGGYVNKVNDIDGVVRRFFPFHKDEAGIIDNYAVELCILGDFYNEKEEEIASNLLLLKDDTIFINYLLKPEDLRVYSLADVFSNKVKPDILKGKIILFGSTTEITHDIYPTPSGNMSGIYIIANSLVTIMAKRFLTEMGYFVTLIILIILALLAGILTFRYGIGRGMLILVSASILFFIISVISFQQGLILDWFSVVFIMFIVSISIAFYRYITILKIHVNELERTNIEIKNAQKEIVRREQLSTIGKLTSKIIHELNNPMGNLADCIEMLRDKIKEPGEVQDIMNLAHKEVVRAKRIGEDLKTAYTPHVEEKVHTDINRLILDIVDLSKQGAGSKGIEIKLNLDEKLPLIPVSPDKIKQVFLNMILNAVDATESGRHICIETSSSTDCVNIIFRDEGCGIPKEELGKIFDAFYTTKKHKKGSGLGLFISDEIIKAHKGRISVESSVGVGTTFTIRLPAKE